LWRDFQVLCPAKLFEGEQDGAIIVEDAVEEAFAGEVEGAGGFVVVMVVIGFPAREEGHEVVGPARCGQVAKHVDAVNGGVKLDRAADDDAGMDDPCKDERAAQRPCRQIGRSGGNKMDEDGDKIIAPVERAGGDIVLDPHRHGAGHVFGITPDDPADPCPALAFKRVVRVAGLVCKAVVLGMIINPIGDFALHGEGEIKGNDDAAKAGNLACPVLPDAVHGADAEIA